MIRFSSILGIYFLAFASCQAQQPRLLPKKQAEGLLLWQRNKVALENIYNNNFKYMVMVSYPIDSFLAQLNDHPDAQILTRYRDEDSKMYHALVGINSLPTLDHIAALAHTSTGFSCGNVELIHPGFAFTASETPHRYPPIYPEMVSFDAVTSLLNGVDKTKITATMQSLVALGTRHHTANPSASNTVKSLLSTAGQGSTVKLSEYAHPDTTPQKSIIGSINGQNNDDEIVIIGAHIDSINTADNNTAPGADDNASGIAVMAETLRLLAVNNLKFKRRIEFHAYAAEEIGLIGSQDIAAAYRGAGKKVTAMLQLDMTAYSTESSDDTIHIVSTDTSPNLQRSLKDLLHTYLGGRFASSNLVGGTSDHKSWTNQGFAAIFPFENPHHYNPFIHSADDTMTNVNNLNLSTRFTKLALAFLAHHAGLVSIADQSNDLINSTWSSFTKDIAIAILRHDGGTYQLAIAAPTSVASIEFCMLATKDAAGCNNERLSLSFSETRNNRHIFLTTDPIDFIDHGYYRIFSYDEADKQVDQRSVQLIKKS